MTQVKCKKCGTVGYSAYEKARCLCGGVCYSYANARPTAKKVHLQVHESWLKHPQIKSLVDQLESLSQMANHYFFNSYLGYLKRIKKAPVF